eukprot:TRINITY_DN778088_c0_g1_i1.p1 TRINITY_DN778088_c0_g1~~TRINITY_DN778088_c0_g1_i1.p1  ORF type:complete len:380 (-),score=105.97 TRINITY_DN778088_c0_g1_i1:235-1374(-)
MSSGGKPGDKSYDLDKLLKVIRWHQLANDAALKAALIESKIAKEKGKRQSTAKRNEARMQMMSQILEEEQQKPLEFNVQFVLDILEKEKVEHERVEQSIQRKIDILAKIKERLEDRQEIRERTKRYHQQTKALKDTLRSTRAKKEIVSEDELQTILSTSGCDKAEEHVFLQQIETLIDIEQRIAVIEHKESSAFKTVAKGKPRQVRKVMQETRVRPPMPSTRSTNLRNTHRAGNSGRTPMNRTPMSRTPKPQFVRSTKRATAGHKEDLANMRKNTERIKMGTSLPPTSKTPSQWDQMNARAAETHHHNSNNNNPTRSNGSRLGHSSSTSKVARKPVHFFPETPPVAHRSRSSANIGGVRSNAGSRVQHHKETQRLPRIR